MRLLAFLVSFLMSFLLFAVQPMATKMVLPTLGGTPAVWNTVMFTFQCLLLLGYLYAHMLARHVPPRAQWAVHGLLIITSAAFLPLAMTLPASDAVILNPIPHLLKACITQIGLPFFCLAATAPLLQSWVSRSAHPLSRTPYVLYSASNFGSFAGLLGYVALVEPLLGVGAQAHIWTGLYLLGCLLLLLAGRLLAPAAQAQTAAAPQDAPGWRARLLWIGLAFLPSSLSLGVTTYITTDIASIPLIWVLPLSLYLLSFVDAFRTRPALVSICQRIAPVTGLAALMLYGFGGKGSLFVFLFHLLAFAVMAFALHGWLASRRPAARDLTQFYVCLSVGGALGGVLNGLLAPTLLRETLEYPVMLIVACLVAFILLQRRDDPATSLSRHLRILAQMLLVIATGTAILYLLLTDGAPLPSGQQMIRAGGISALATLLLYRNYTRAVYACMVVTMILVAAISTGLAGTQTLFKDRNFFGTLRVYEDPQQQVRYIVHDTTVHGVQSQQPSLRLKPLAYYPWVQEVKSSTPGANRRPMAVVGLGAGTLKCLATPGQQVDLYEINPMVVAIAQDASRFTYLRDCPGTSRLLLGDGRIRLAAQPDGRYGLIVLDAFSSDAIPNHLLTTEALAMYLRKLAPGGVIAIHTTNRHIDLWPLLGTQAEALGVTAYGKYFSAPEPGTHVMSAYWAVIARTPHDVGALKAKGWAPLPGEHARPWTDDYVNLLPYLKALR